MDSSSSKAHQGDSSQQKHSCLANCRQREECNFSLDSGCCGDWHALHTPSSQSLPDLSTAAYQFLFPSFSLYALCFNCPEIPASLNTLKTLSPKPYPQITSRSSSRPSSEFTLLMKLPLTWVSLRRSRISLFAPCFPLTWPLSLHTWGMPWNIFLPHSIDSPREWL